MIVLVIIGLFWLSVLGAYMGIFQCKFNTIWPSDQLLKKKFFNQIQNSEQIHEKLHKKTDKKTQISSHRAQKRPREAKSRIL